MLTTNAPKPHASARRMSSSVFDRFENMYRFCHSIALGAARRIASIE
jgi:hypothetical protein